MAAELARQIWKKGKLPVLVGGTGFYFETFLNGLSPMPKIPGEISHSLAVRLEKYGLSTLYEELASIDPEYHAAIHFNDKQRILRAHEVWEASGKTFSWWRQRPPKGFAGKGPLFVLNYPLNKLEPRLLQRIETMLKNGALDETARAREKCQNVNSPGWSCIGARECLAILNGECSDEQAVARWLKATRAYAKRQITWFRHRKNAINVKPDQFIDAVIRQIKSNSATSQLLQA